MVAELVDVIPAPPALRLRKPGPRGRTDVHRPAACPLGHRGRIRIDRVSQNGPFYTRVGYRCVRREWDPVTRAWVVVRHRFVDRSAEDPLPRRHPTHKHSYSSDACPTCEHTYAPDEGPRAGRRFFYTAAEIASLLTAVGKGESIRKATAQVRRDALRYRPATAPHLGPEKPSEETPTSRWPIEILDAIDAAGDRYADATFTDTDWDIRFRPAILREPELLGESPWDDDPEADPEPPVIPGKRRRRRRRIRPDAPDDPTKMVGNEDFLSRSSATGAEQIDEFAAAVAVPFQHTRWPSVMVLDSQPVRRRAVVSSDESTRVASDFLCEIVGVSDATTHELILLYPAGGKDPESLKEVFATKEGAPSWIVTDGDQSMPAAIQAAFPAAIHYRCEDHLRKDAQAAPSSIGSPASRSWSRSRTPSARRCIGTRSRRPSSRTSRQPSARSSASGSATTS